MVMNENIEDVNNELESIRIALQNYLERIVIVEKVSFRRYIDDDNVLSMDFTMTDVYFVVVNHINRQFTLYSSEEDPQNL